MRSRTKPTPTVGLQLLAAAADTAAAKTTAKSALEAYRANAQNHFLHWLSAHPQREGVDTSYLARWQADWAESRSGRHADRTLSPHLARFRKVVGAELRLTAETARDRIRAIQRKAEEIIGRDSDGSWEDQTLDRIVKRAAARLEGSA